MDEVYLVFCTRIDGKNNIIVFSEKSLAEQYINDQMDNEYNKKYFEFTMRKYAVEGESYEEFGL